MCGHCYNHSQLFLLSPKVSITVTITTTSTTATTTIYTHTLLLPLLLPILLNSIDMLRQIEKDGWDAPSSHRQLIEYMIVCVYITKGECDECECYQWTE